ncbi:MAG: M55 family metallopeptidase [Candidatus Cloacimonetes bacterium]|nr:M55 family metallopeptidase [Candidatus Cloacimonadota bacterium]
MKIYISIDMEGMPGTFNWAQEKKDRRAVQNCIFDHVKTVIEAIRQSPRDNDITEIVIADSHAAGDNLPYEITALDERVALISGGPRPYYMMPVLSADYDRVFFLGYHAGTGALHGNMDHTYSSSRIQRININGRAMNETLINAAYAGYLGIPVTLVTGDLALQQELALSDAMPWVDFVTTKEATAKFAAKNFSQTLVRRQTTAAVGMNLARPRDDFPLYRVTAPITLTIEFRCTSMADMAAIMPGVKRLDGRTVEYSHADYAVIFEAIMALVILAYSSD